VVGAPANPSGAAHPALPTAAAPSLQLYTIRFVPPPRLFARGANLLPLFDELRGLGDLTITADSSALPPLANLEPDHCYLAFDMRLRASCPPEAIRDVFVFVDEGDSLTITVQPPTGTAVPASAVASGNAAAHATTSSLRVSAAKLDELINIVGELVTMQARLSRFAVESGEIEISYIAEETERLTNMLRDNTMSIRMLPIEATFARYRRLVRDLAGELGKEIELVTEGGDTELDKSVIDQIADPLVHIIRNSVDHGIESPAERRQAGKAPGGRLVLSAAHSGSHVLIRVADDGRGIDPARVRAKAIEKGLLDPHAELSEAEVFALIFRTGFSTAASVSSVSGRGVGMDVVKRNVEALRGTIDLTSTPGRGTTITLKLPLTLAIIDGLLVRVSTQHFVFPVAQVLECLEIDLAEFAARRHEYIEVRGKLVPLILLRRFFTLPAENLRRGQILIAQTAIGHCGFVVDEVIGDHKTVIKQLGPLYRQVEGVAGATILGDGGIALILDADKLAQSATHEVVRTAA
jgi:two-component system chemotaxis sensor kinase CheA